MSQVELDYNKCRAAAHRWFNRLSKVQMDRETRSFYINKKIRELMEQLGYTIKAHLA